MESKRKSNFIASNIRAASVASALSRRSSAWAASAERESAAVFASGCARESLVAASTQFKFDEAISIHITCDSQQEIDELWQQLTVDGGAEGPCGWLKDKYGLSWQIDSRALHEMMISPDQEGATRATNAMLGMKKLDVQVLQDAFDGRA